MVDDLIKALLIFRKYSNSYWPTHCEHDELIIMDVHADEVSEEDIVELETLGFYWTTSEMGECFSSFRFGSA